jgi:hypothetical protein
MPLAYLPSLLPQPKRSQDLVLGTQPVESGGDMRRFAAVGRYAHRGDPRWIPSLPYARQTALRTASTAGFLGIARNLGLGDEVVGAIAARAEAADDERDSIGWWGLFDAINVGELAERMFYQAETWLFENTPGIAALRGPASMEPLTPAGLLVDGFDAWPAALLPYNPPYYPELVEEEGYEREREWSAWTLDCGTGAPADSLRQSPAAWQAWAAACDALNYPEENAPQLSLWLSRLAGGAEFSAHPHLRWALSRAFVRAVRVEREGGLCLGIPDFAPALRLTGGRLFPLGYALYLLALSRARRLRVFPALAPKMWRADRLRELYAALAESAASSGFSELVIAPIYDDDEKNAEALSGLGARVTQQFAIYEKSF